MWYCGNRITYEANQFILTEAFYADGSPFQQSKLYNHIQILSEGIKNVIFICYAMFLISRTQLRNLWLSPWLTH